MATEIFVPTHAPGVSVIIPARDRKDYVLQMLCLLSEQTHPAQDIEVIVVDDGSTDGTREAIAERRLPFRMTCHSLGSAGMAFWAARPRNAGLRLATGAVAVLLDSDVFVNAGFVAAHVALHTSRPLGARPRIGIGDIFGTSQDNEARSAARLHPPTCGDLAELVRIEQRPPSGWTEGRAEYARAWPELATCPVPWLFFWAGNVSMPREFAAALGGFDEEFRGWGCEDNDLGYRMFRAGAEYSWVPAAWGVHYPHPIRPAMEAEVRRNCMYLLRKFPEPLVEAVLWSVRLAHRLDLPSVPPGSSIDTWRIEVVREVEQARHASLAEPAPMIPNDLLARAEAACAASDRPVLWCGPFPDAQQLPSSVVRSHLFGLATPWSDREFSGAIAVDYWTLLSPARLRAVLRELSRVASRVILAVTGSCHVPAALHQELVAMCRQRAPDDASMPWELVTCVTG